MQQLNNVKSENKTIFQRSKNPVNELFSNNSTNLNSIRKGRTNHKESNRLNLLPISITEPEVILHENLEMKEKMKKSNEEIQNTKRKAEQIKNEVDNMKELYNKYESNLVYNSQENENLKASLNKINASFEIYKAECKIKMKSLEDQNQNYICRIEILENEKKQLMDKFGIYSEQVMKANKGTIETITFKNNEKVSKLKKKISDQKGQIMILSEEIQLQKKLFDESKQSFESTVSKLHIEIGKIKDEYYRKIEENDLLLKRKIAEKDAKVELQISQTHNEIQRNFDQRLNEIKSEANSKIIESNESKIILENQFADLKKNLFDISKIEELLEHERKKVLDEQNQVQSNLKMQFETEFKLKQKELESELHKKYVAAIKNCQKTISTLEKALSESKVKQNMLIEKMKSSKNEYENILEDMKEKNLTEIRKVKELEETLNRKEEKLKEKEEKVNSLDQLNVKNNSIINDLNNKFIKMQETLVSISTENLKFKELYEMSNDKHKSSIDELNKLKFEHEEMKSRLTNELGKNKLKNDELIQTNKELSQKLFENEKEIKAESKIKMDILSKLEVSLKLIENYQKTIKDLNKLNEDSKKFIIKSNKEYMLASSTKNERIKYLYEKLKCIKLAYIDFSSEVKQKFFFIKEYSEKEISVFENQLTSSVSGIKDKLKEFFNKGNKLYSTLQEKEINRIRFKEEAEKRTEEIFEKINLENRKTIEEMSKKIEELENSISYSNNEITLHLNRIDDLQKEKNHLLSENEDLKIRANVLKQNIQNMKSQQIIMKEQKKEQNININTKSSFYELEELNQMRSKIIEFQTDTGNELRLLYEELKNIDSRQRQEVYGFINKTENMEKNFNKTLSNEMLINSNLIEELNKSKIVAEKLEENAQELNQKRAIHEENIKLLEQQKELQNENSNLIGQLKQLLEENNYLKSKITEATELNSLKENENYSNSMKFTKIVAKKEKEISDLQDMLSNSFKILNTSYEIPKTAKNAKSTERVQKYSFNELKKSKREMERILRKNNNISSEN